VYDFLAQCDRDLSPGDLLAGQCRTIETLRAASDFMGSWQAFLRTGNLESR
jgi:hypothetical protein